MQLVFPFFLIGLIGILPVYFISLNHIELNKHFGIEKGKKLGEVLGRISGWSFFVLLAGLWFAPQKKYQCRDFFDKLAVNILTANTNILSLVIGLVLFVSACVIGIKGVVDLTMKVSETHRPERVIKGGIYARIRHPQYVAAALAHVGFSILLHSLYSIIATPIVFIVIYVISKKEEKELLKEFKNEYSSYMCIVPMFFGIKKKILK